MLGQLKGKPTEISLLKNVFRKIIKKPEIANIKQSGGLWKFQIQLNYAGYMLYNRRSFQSLKIIINLISPFS